MDDRILAAAREVFVADPRAPMAAVGERAGVGMSALYRRFAGKEDLLRRLCLDGLHAYAAAAEAALADAGDPGEAFAAFLRRVVDADTHSLTLRLAGTFTPTMELYAEAARAQELTRALFARAQRAGALRPDLAVDDLALVLEQVAAVRLGDAERTRALRRRYLALQLDGLRAAPAGPLPGPPPAWEEIGARWDA